MGLAAIQTLCDDKLRSVQLGSTLGDPAKRDRAIGLALEEYDRDMPRRLVATATGVTGKYLALPSGWVAGRSTLVEVEYPVGEWPRRTVEAAVMVDAADQTKIVLADTSVTAATLRITFSAPHELSSGTSSVPPEHENALACWAVAELCRQLATGKSHERDATMNAAAVGTSSAGSDLARRAREWLTQYRQQLGLPDPEAAVPGNAAAAVVTWGRTHVRDRFTTLRSGA